jgi:hypothetical protein
LSQMQPEVLILGIQLDGVPPHFDCVLPVLFPFGLSRPGKELSRKFSFFFRRGQSIYLN